MPVRQWLTFALFRIAPAAPLVLVLAACTLVFYRLVLHPLARVPGPKLAAVSNVWHALHAREGRMFALGKMLHKKYGPVVRVGPNEVWFDSKEAFKSIYRAGSKYEKSEFYLATLLQKPTMDWMGRLHFADSLDLLSERDMTRYRLQRRLIGPIYQTASLKRHESAIDTVLEKVITQIRSLNGAEVDLKEWMHIIAVECLGAIVLGWSPGYLKDKTDWGSSNHGYMGWRRKSVFGLFPIIAKAEVISGEISYAFARLWGLTFKASKTLKPFFTGVYRQSSRRITAELAPKAVKPSKLGKAKKAPDGSRKDLLADLIQLHKEKPEFNETYLRRMAVTNFGAGHETMCSALTSIMAMIGSNPTVQAKVAAEVRSSEGPSDFDNAVRLQYMQAAIKEAQRLHPVLGMSLSRTVPTEGLQAHGFHFPVGTTVGCNPVSLHRNPEIFGADAESFNPDRWLETEDVRAMDRYNLTWGGGNRTCPGRHLAYLVVYKVVPALMKEFDVEVSMPPEEEIRYYFMAMLTGIKLMMRIIQSLSLVGLWAVGLSLLLVSAQRDGHDLVDRGLTPRVNTYHGPQGEAKIGEGDRFNDGEDVPHGAGIQNRSKKASFHEFKTILGYKEIESAMKALQREYGVMLTHPPESSFEDRKTIIGMIPCDDVPLGITGNSCGMPSTYSAYFTGSVHGRERGTSDAIIYFLSDLLYARKHQTGLDYGNNVKFTNGEVHRALSVGIVFYPMVNVDGVIWDQSTDDCWRRNRNTDSADHEVENKQVPNGRRNMTIGVDVNRNFDFAFDFFRILNSTFGIIGNSASPASEFFQGRHAFSERESRNAAWVFDAFPNVSWFMDVRTFGRHIFHPWGLDLNQVSKPEENWRNEAYDGQRGDTWDDNYGEFMDVADNDLHSEVAERIADAMDGVANMTHTFGESAYLYPQTGGVMDWAYARHIVDGGKTKVMSFTMEMGDMEDEAMGDLEKICPFYPTVEAFNISLREAAVGFMTFLLAVAENTR
ncbi:hypothetical protein ACHAQH_008957 [Verticillium albo-atrum]